MPKPPQRKGMCEWEDGCDARGQTRVPLGIGRLFCKFHARQFQGNATCVVTVDDSASSLLGASSSLLGAS